MGARLCGKLYLETKETNKKTTSSHEIQHGAGACYCLVVLAADREDPAKCRIAQLRVSDRVQLLSLIFIISFFFALL